MPHARLALVSLPLLAGASTAAAQSGAPGVCDCAAPAPVVVAPAPAPEGWDGRRWSLGVFVGSLGVAPEERPDAEQEFGGGGLEASYRLDARWEFSLRLEGGEQEDGARAYSATTLQAAYHLRPYSRWDAYLLAGFGGTEIGPEDADADARTAYGHAHLGVGIERRFRRWGLSAELRAVGLSPAEEDTADVMPPPTTRDPQPAAPEVEPVVVEELSGGAFSLAATYYF